MRAHLSVRCPSSVCLSDLWVTGWNKYGQLGYGPPADCGRSGNVPCQREPVRVPHISSAIGIAAGFKHTLILLRGGQVLSFGDNSSGQLGRPTVGTSSQTPALIDGLQEVVQVGAGSDMSYALTRSGELYAFGSNSEGQLGTGEVDEAAHPEPYLVPLGEVAMIAAANRTALALMRNGQIKSWGQNHVGQAGVGEMTDNVLTPTTVLTPAGALEEVKLVFGDGFVSGALTRDGRTFMWGLGSLGQLGQGSLVNGERDIEDRWVASEVPVAEADRAFFHIIEAEVGAGGPTLALSREGDLYGWGWSFRGSLGLFGAIDAWAYSSPVLIFSADE